MNFKFKKIDNLCGCRKGLELFFCDGDCQTGSYEDYREYLDKKNERD